ncbi:hypothetical protein HC928_19030 [bacterium]|nr:hypothetical protein [bacterium]
MTELAQQMMNLQMAPQNTQTPSAIFGTAGSLRQSLMTRPPVRIGLWPCISRDDPASAMGLVTALAVLLERWASIRVYRIFVRADGDPQTFAWEMTASQFTVDEWQLDGLDENVALWGTLDQTAEGWRFALELENDLAETEENTVLEYAAADLKTLFNTLETVANDIAAELQVFGTITGAAVENLTDVSETALTDVLAAMFYWQKDLILLLWGQVKPDEMILADYDRLITSARLAYSGLAAWGVGGVVAHTLQPGYGAAADLILPLASQLSDELYRSPLVPGFIALGMFQRWGSAGILSTSGRTSARK